MLYVYRVDVYKTRSFLEQYENMLFSIFLSLFTHESIVCFYPYMFALLDFVTWFLMVMRPIKLLACNFGLNVISFNLGILLENYVGLSNVKIHTTGKFLIDRFSNGMDFDA